MLPIQQKTDIIDKEQYRVLLEEEFCETPEGERMIVCNNCGASYADDAPRCPYCGGDNFEKSVHLHGFVKVVATTVRAARCIVCI